MAVSVKGLLGGAGAVGLGAAGWAARGLGMGPVMLAGAAAGGLFGSAYKKAAGAKKDDGTKPPPVVPQDKMTGDGVPAVLDEIRNEISSIKDILTSQPDPASQEREKALDEEAKQRKLIQAISGIKFGKSGKDKPRGFWEWLKALLPGILALAGIAAIPKILENLPEIFKNIQNIVDKIGAFLKTLDDFFTSLGVEFSGAALMGIGKGMRVISRFIGKTPKPRPGPKKGPKKPGRFAGMMKNIKAKFKAFGKAMLKGINKVYGKAKAGLGKMFRSFGKAFSRGWRATTGVAGRGIKAMQDWAKKFDFKGKMKTWGTAVKNWGSRFSARALGWWSAIDDLKTRTVTRISTAWKDFKTQANAKVTSMAKTFKANMMSLANRTLTGVRSLGTKITTGISDLTKGARGWTRSLSISAQGHMANLLTSFDDWKAKLKGKFDTHSSNLKTNFDDFKTKLKGKFDTHTTGLRNTWSRLSTSLSQKWSGPGGIKESFDGKVKGFRTAFDDFKTNARTLRSEWAKRMGAQWKVVTGAWDNVKVGWEKMKGGWTKMTGNFARFTTSMTTLFAEKFPKTTKPGGGPRRVTSAYAQGYEKIDWSKKGGTGSGRGAMVEKPGQRVQYRNAGLSAMRWTQMGRGSPSVMARVFKTDKGPDKEKVKLGQKMSNKYPKLMKFLTRFGGKALGVAGMLLLLWELGTLTSAWAKAKPWYDVNPFGDDAHDEVFKKGVLRLAYTYGGGFLGAILGGFLGTIVGGPVGGFVGSLIGGVGGAIAGDKLFEWLGGEVPNNAEQIKNEQGAAGGDNTARVVGADYPVVVTPETSGEPMGAIISQQHAEGAGLIQAGAGGGGTTVVNLEQTYVNSTNNNVNTSNSTAASIVNVKKGPRGMGNRFKVGRD